MIPERPLPPAIDPIFRDYFEGLRQGQILIPLCEECGQLQFPPRGVCARCQNTSFRAKEFGLEGTVYTFTVVYRAFHPWFQERVPYGVVAGDLGSGVRILGCCFDDPESLACGMRVTAQIDRTAEVPVLQWSRL